MERAPDALPQRVCVPNYSMPAHTMLVQTNLGEQNRTDIRTGFARKIVQMAPRKRLNRFARPEIGEIRSRKIGFFAVERKTAKPVRGFSDA